MSQVSELTVIDKYSVIKRISEGSSGVVYLVEHFGKKFALKHLKTSDAATIARFRRESSTLARLNHENLLKIFDVGEFKGTPYLVMELLEGATLAEEIVRQERVSEADAVTITICVARALSELHKNALLHRDIKPSNIFVTTQGVARLIDLGLVGNVDQIKAESSFVGTPVYCSPEQSRILKRDVDYRSDLYSLGVTLFETLAGRPPFIGTTSEVMQHHASRVAPDIREINPQVRAALVIVIAKALAKDPDDRYQSTSGLISDLERLDEIDRLLAGNEDPRLGSKDRATLTTKVKYVERQVETARLRNAWSKVLDGNPGLVIVSGASGSGKTRLCEEFMELTRIQNPLVLRTKCQFFDRELPFAPVREAIDGMLEEIGSMPGELRAECTRRLLDAGLGYEAQLISFSRGFEDIFPKAVLLESPISNIEGSRDVFLNALSEFFIRLNAAWNSSILFVDDLQWLDRSSQLLFQMIFENAGNSRFLLLGTARDDQDSRSHMEAIEQGFSEPLSDKIEIHAFSKSQMRSLTAEYLGAREISDSIVDSIYQKSKANIFIAIEYLRAGLEQGFLTFEEGHWHLDLETLEKIALSENVYDLIVRRIETSSKDAKAFLQYAAFYGNVFRASDIAAIAGASGDSLEAILYACSDLAIVEQISAEKWKFVHDKIPESLIRSLTPEAARDICDRLANGFFEKNTKTTDEAFVTARLFASGNVEKNVERVIFSQIAAGDLAFLDFAYREAYAFYNFAHELINTHDVERSSEVAMAANFAICATMVSEDALATRCVDLYVENAKSKDKIFQAITLKIWILNIQSRPVHGWEYFKKACALVGKPYPTYLHWKILQIGWTYYLTLLSDFLGIRVPQKWFFRSEKIDINQLSNLYRNALLCCELRVNHLDLILVSLRFALMGQLVGGHKERALGYTSVGFAYALFGLRGLALSYFDRAKRHCDLLGDPTITAIYEMRRLQGSFYCGAITDFIAAYMEKRDFLTKYLSPAENGRLVAHATNFYASQGMHQESITLQLGAISASERKATRLPGHTVAGMLNQTWYQMALLGQNQESQKISAVALTKSYELRHCPSVVRSVLNAEIGLLRVSEKLDNRTDEILAGFWKRRNSKSGDPTIKNFSGLMTFILLLQFERAKTREEIFSTRRELKAMLRHLFLTLHTPLFRVNYYFLQGGYYRVVGKYGFAEYFYKKAELLASRSGNLRVLFDIGRDRARIYRKRGHLELMKMSLVSSMNLALEHGWKVSADLLVAEFKDYLQLPVSGQERGASETYAYTSLNQSRFDKTSLKSTVHPSATGGQTFAGTAFGRKGDIGEGRFANALMEVSAAFVSSADSSEQSKMVLNQIVKLFAAERGFIFILDGENPEPRILAGKDSEGLDLRSLKGYSSTVVKRAIAEVKPIIVTGTDGGEAIGSDSAVLHGLRSIMATPLTIKDRVIGAAYLDSSLTKGLFTAADIELFALLANHISVAFELMRITKVEFEKAELQKDLEVQSAIASESKKVKLLVDNMQQALFSVESDGTIVEPVSRYSEKVFAQPISNKNILDTLFKDLEKEKLDSVRSALTTAFGEDELQWDLMQDNIARKISFTVPDGEAGQAERRTLKTQISPVWDEAGNLEKIVFVVEDVTSLEALETQVFQNRKDAQMLEDLIKGDPEELRDYFRSAKVMTASFKARPPLQDVSEMASLMRDLHTLKGNARLYNLQQLSDQVHESESVLAGLLSSLVKQEDCSSSLLVELSRIEAIIDQYKGILEKIRPSVKSDSEAPSSLKLSAIAQLREFIDTRDGQVDQKWFNTLGIAVQRLTYRSVKDLAFPLEKMVQDLSRQLGKKVSLTVQGDALVDDEQFKSLQDCFIHLIRNSIDHGVEEPGERLKRNKPENGAISIQCIDDLNGITITVADDGSGMDEDRIVTKAIEKRMLNTIEAAKLTREEKLNLIFMPNFSIRDDASDISGRGIGMDAVRDSIGRIGGDLKWSTKLGEGSKFTISFKAARPI